jgi:hypothetical protein
MTAKNLPITPHFRDGGDSNSLRNQLYGTEGQSFIANLRAEPLAELSNGLRDDRRETCQPAMALYITSWQILDAYSKSQRN